jgi:alanyl-tRNA synthetase
LGKGVKLLVKGKPVDTLFTEIDDSVKNMKDSKKRLEEINNLFNAEANDALNSSGLSKEDINCIKSTMDEVRNMEHSKLQFYAKDLAKKIKEYTKNNK